MEGDGWSKVVKMLQMQLRLVLTLDASNFNIYTRHYNSNTTYSEYRSS
jgi:hypothetical protein